MYLSHTHEAIQLPSDLEQKKRRKSNATSSSSHDEKNDHFNVSNAESEDEKQFSPLFNENHSFCSFSRKRRFLSKIEDFTSDLSSSMNKNSPSKKVRFSSNIPNFNRTPRGSKTMIVNSHSPVGNKSKDKDPLYNNYLGEVSFLDSASNQNTPITSRRPSINPSSQQETILTNRFQKEKKILDLEHQFRKKKKIFSDSMDIIETENGNKNVKLSLIFALLMGMVLSIVLYPMLAN